MSRITHQFALQSAAIVLDDADAMITATRLVRFEVARLLRSKIAPTGLDVLESHTAMGNLSAYLALCERRLQRAVALQCGEAADVPGIPTFVPDYEATQN